MKARLHQRDGIPRFTRLLLAGEPATIVAFGTSMTLRGAYLERLPAALKGAYPASQVTIVNQGRNGYMTLAAAFRVADDVLPHAPDLVLLEFAHNDVTGNLVDFVPAALEGILGQIRAVRPECEFAFVYLALPGTAASGPTPAMEAHERVAHDHGIPSIDLAALSEELVETGQATWRAGERALTVDGVHHAPAAAALLGVPFAEAFLSLLVPPHEAAPPPAPRRGALTRVARVRVADYLRAGVWVVRPPLPAEARGAGIDEEGIAEAREPGAVVRLTIEGTNAFVWTSGNGVLGVRIAEIGAAYRVAVEAAGKWMWCSLMETQPAARYTLEIVALNAGLLLGDIGIVGKLAS